MNINQNTFNKIALYGTLLGLVSFLALTAFKLLGWAVGSWWLVLSPILFVVVLWFALAYIVFHEINKLDK